MNLLEKLKEILYGYDCEYPSHLDVVSLKIGEFISQLLKEACKEQREICAKLVVNTAPADNSEICMNAPEPSELKGE